MKAVWVAIVAGLAYLIGLFARRDKTDLSPLIVKYDQKAKDVKADLEKIQKQRQELAVKDLTLEEELEYWKQNGRQ